MDNTCNPGLSINSLRKGKTSHDLSWDVEVIAKKAISKTKTKHRTAAECNLQVWSHVSLVPKKGQTYFNHAVEAGPTSTQTMWLSLVTATCLVAICPIPVGSPITYFSLRTSLPITCFGDCLRDDDVSSLLCSLFLRHVGSCRVLQRKQTFLNDDYVPVPPHPIRRQSTREARAEIFS